MSPLRPNSLDEMALLGFDELRELHRAATCPDPKDFTGVAAGRILHPKPTQFLRLWRGKVFDREGDTVGGFNRIGVGPFEVKRYRFEVRVATSAFEPRQLVLLDHDNAANPAWVRRFHDEVVQLKPGLYLASSHVRAREQLRYVGYFALDLRPSK